jgi:hypothetical protein
MRSTRKAIEGFAKPRPSTRNVHYWVKPVPSDFGALRQLQGVFASTPRWRTVLSIAPDPAGAGVGQAGSEWPNLLWIKCALGAQHTRHVPRAELMESWTSRRVSHRFSPQRQVSAAKYIGRVKWPFASMVVVMPVNEWPRSRRSGRQANFDTWFEPDDVTARGYD